MLLSELIDDLQKVMADHGDKFIRAKWEGGVHYFNMDEKEMTITDDYIIIDVEQYPDYEYSEKMQLLFNEDFNGFERHKKGDIIYYTPWYHQWQGMSEPKRIEKGIFVRCLGHGEFDVFRTPMVSIYSKNKDGTV